MNWIRWRSPVLLGLVCFLAGCPDGYPTSHPEDADFPASSVDLTQVQRLQRLNEMGADTSPHLRWNYTLATGCRLQVEHQERRLFARSQVASVPLFGTEIRIEALETEPELYRVIGVRDAAGQAQSQDALTLLHDQGSWPDAIQFRALLTHLQRDCRASGASATPVLSSPP
ncbi:hypothetical protein HZU83_03765 [Sphaerotilus montanus]|uniref:Lipoprotein n=1 Tax=Sphaerotilus montanus TaxID=522889 RepID=A0A7Y9QZJ7_9BURK|nr:hypothetical protein [Sphaerotilus montanus]NYG34143.1 hypothetical protein [Sphaerotilus montanus]NZD55793.1 hypothetical protein [Sphaerotilus montanus]